MDDTLTAQDGAKSATTLNEWDRQDYETHHEFALFQTYLGMPAPRSASALAVATGRTSARSLDRLRTKNKWAMRAAAYDTWRINQALQHAPKEVENPYERMLFQAATRAQALHDAAALLLHQATRRLEWGERQYMAEVAKAGRQGDTVEPPTPPPSIVSAMRGAMDAMDKSNEAQAMLLGLTDVMKLQSQGANGQ